jgi:8-oxo-dGTP pyrophosphatase MutT (NUDIX family)
MVRRHHQVDFMSGAMVFPGGKVDDGDRDPAWAGHATGWETVPEVERGPRIAAIREAFEESGILLGATGPAADPDATAAERQAIEKGEMRFLDYVAARRLTLDLSALTLFSRWLTPSVVPKRFDTFFYLAAAPAEQAARHDGHETVDTEWVSPAEALRLAAAGERTIVFPTRMNLTLLSASRSLAAAVAAAQARPRVTVEPQVESRDGQHFLKLDAALGYGAVEEALVIPTRPAA